MDPREPPGTILGVDRTHALIFAGGGNQGRWHAGRSSAPRGTGWCRSPLLIVTSAGTAMAFTPARSAITQALVSCRASHATKGRLVLRAWLLPRRIAVAHARSARVTSHLRGGQAALGWEAMQARHQGLPDLPRAWKPSSIRLMVLHHGVV